MTDSIVCEWLSRVYCNLQSFEDIFPINSNFDYKKNDFCKKCIGGFWLFDVISICLEVMGTNMQVSVMTTRMHFFSK